MEPTPRAGPCLEELGEFVDEDSIATASSILERVEYIAVDLLLEPPPPNSTMYLRTLLELECIRVLELRVVSCRDDSLKRLLTLADEPEVSRVVMEGECIEIVVPVDPPYRAKSLIEKLGLNGKLAITGFRPVEWEGGLA